MPNTVRFHRVLRATPERVYRAFLDPDAMVKWLPPNGFTGKVHQLDAKVGARRGRDSGLTMAAAFPGVGRFASNFGLCCLTALRYRVPPLRGLIISSHSHSLPRAYAARLFSVATPWLRLDAVFKHLHELKPPSIK